MFESNRWGYSNQDQETKFAAEMASIISLEEMNRFKTRLIVVLEDFDCLFRITQPIYESLKKILDTALNKLDEITEYPSIKIINDYRDITDPIPRKIYQWPLFDAFCNMQEFQHILIFQFYLCSPHIRKFIIEQFYSNDSTAIKAYTDLLKTELKCYCDTIEVKSVINAKIANILVELTLNKEIMCNFIWLDGEKDEHLLEFVKLLCYRKVERVIFTCSKFSYFKCCIWLADFFEQLNGGEILKPDLNIIMYEVDEFPKTIILRDERNIISNFISSCVLIGEETYIPIVSLIWYILEKENFVIIKEPMGWKKIYNSQRTNYDWASLHSEKKHIFYMYATV